MAFLYGEREDVDDVRFFCSTLMPGEEFDCLVKIRSLFGEYSPKGCLDDGLSRWRSAGLPGSSLEDDVLKLFSFNLILFI